MTMETPFAERRARGSK